MYIHSDYRYVITCSTLPRAVRRELRKLVRGKVAVTYDRRTRRETPVSAEVQCRRIAEVLNGLEALRVNGFALQSPLNFSAKHLLFMADRWSEHHMTREECAERYDHRSQFFLWIRKRQLISLLNAWMIKFNLSREHVGRCRAQRVGYVRPAIPVLTPEKIMKVLDEQRGNLNRAAIALGTSTRSVCEALCEGQPLKNELPPGLTILSGTAPAAASNAVAAPEIDWDVLYEAEKRLLPEATWWW